MLRVLFSSLLMVCLLMGSAWASPFDGWEAADIFAHPDFVRDDYSLSQATNSGDPDAPHVYYWVGYIPVDDTRIYFTSFGEPLTCVQWEATGEWVPLWVVDALDLLLDEGLIIIEVGEKQLLPGGDDELKG